MSVGSGSHYPIVEAHASLLAMNKSLLACLSAAMLISVPTGASATAAKEVAVGTASESVELATGSKQSNEQLVISVIDDAKSEIRVLAINFTSKPIARALLRAERRGVDVKVLVDRENTIHSDYGAAKRSLRYLTGGGIDVRLLSVSPPIQDCGIVTDDHIVQFGAADYSTQARLDSEELSVNWNSRELAAAYKGRFQRDSDAAQPFGAR